MHTFRGIIFDFNGVLIFDEYLHDAAWNKVIREIREYGPSKDELLKHFSGRNNKLIFEYLFGRTLDPKELENWSTKKEHEYQELSRREGEKYKLSPGAEDLLNQLKKRGVPRTIATSSPKMNMDFFDEMLHLHQWFDMEKIVCDGGTMRGKPAPDVYREAAKRLSLDPQECVVIEDSRAGLASAHAANIGYIIALGPKNEHQALMQIPGVTETIETLADVSVTVLFG